MHVVLTFVTNDEASVTDAAKDGMDFWVCHAGIITQ